MPAPSTPVNPWIVAVAVMFGTFMVFLDTSVVNLSLPYMAGSLAATVSEATWSLTSYLAANAVVLPMAGWLANHFGRKRLMRIALAAFTVASLLCGLAPNLGWLVVFRIIQGLSGGVLQPLSQAVLLESFPLRDRGKAMGFWSVGIVLAPILGPVVGGFLTYHYNWRWVFLINIPVGVVALVMVELFVFDPHYIRRRAGSIDYWGMGLLALGVGALQIMLDKGQEEDWLDSALITWLLVVGLLAVVGFILHELRTEHPVVDLRVFRHRTFAVGTLLTSQVGFILFASILILPLLLQTQLGYPPLEAGLMVVPRALGSFLAFPLVGVLVGRIDPRKLLVLGLVLGLWTMFWLATLNRDLAFTHLFVPQFIQGWAIALLFVPLTTVSMDPISNEAMGNATSLFNVTRNFGSSIGIAVIATLLERRQTGHRQQLAAHLDAYSVETQLRFEQLVGLFLADGADPHSAEESARLALGRLLESQAGMLAFLDAFRFLGWLFVGMIPLVFLMRRPRRAA